MPADKLTGAARAAIGQGLGMGWGDEAEAWLRSKLGQGDYQPILNKIRNEYGAYAKENPVTSVALEFAGGAVPGVASMFVPGGQAVGASRLAAGISPLLRSAGLGAATGAISGAGSANENNRTAGAVTGGAIGGTFGAALPPAISGATSAVKWLKDRLAQSEPAIVNSAVEKMSNTLQKAGMRPSEISASLRADRNANIPSTAIYNTNPALVNLAEAVAVRSGSNSKKLQEKLLEQKLGSNDRAISQVKKALHPGEFYSDMSRLEQEMKDMSSPLYQAAYDVTKKQTPDGFLYQSTFDPNGAILDPEILSYLKLPQFQKGINAAKELLSAEGRHVDMSKPTVEMLDQTKRGLDALIENETDPITGKVTALGRVYANSKNGFLQALDKAVPEYELARGVYAGGAGMREAMRKGYNEFNKLDPEEVAKLYSGLNTAEKHAYKTGVARSLYDDISSSATDSNAAQKIIRSKKNQEKLQQLFDSPEQFNLFKSALERESQLYEQSNNVLKKLNRGRSSEISDELIDSPASGAARSVISALRGRFGDSLTAMATMLSRNDSMTPNKFDELSRMLMSSDPHEVSAVVKLLEDYSNNAAPRELFDSAIKNGVVSGTSIAITPPPGTNDEPNIEEEISGNNIKNIDGPDIELDLKKMNNSRGTEK
jgi:hypothetical protein